ncbi:hypothetical protein UlMin_039670 [Ulmus minor]
MTVATAATTHTKKLVKMGLSLFRRRFNASKCKTAAKMAVARIKLLKNKRQVVVKQMRRDIALLIQSGQDATARIRVEHVIREQNVLAANEFIELFCELIVSRLSIIAKQRECPADLKEGIASLIFAAPRCSELPELAAIRDVFEKKYGRDFVSAATDVRPNCGVNRMLIDKLSVRTPTGEFKLKILKEIAKEHQIEWDTTETEMELLKAPEERIEGPRTFVSATSLPVKPVQAQSIELNKSTTSTTKGPESGSVNFVDTASAAKAAAKCANEAIAAAKAAAYLANKDSKHASSQQQFDNLGYESLSRTSTESFMPDDHHPPMDSQYMHHHQSKSSGRTHESQSFNGSHYPSNVDDNRKMYKRHSYNAPSVHSDVKFDESDCDEEFEADTPPSSNGILPPERSPPPVPPSQARRNSAPPLHPKLPDYDTLSARFEALKNRKS